MSEFFRDLDSVLGRHALEDLSWQPDSQLHELPGRDGAPVWESLGGRARFTADFAALQGPLPAGWYELHGFMEAVKGEVVAPGLHPQYVGDSIPHDAELSLPEPDASGHISTLLMFFEDVQSLAFYPGIQPMQFRMHGFRLRRVSQLRALHVMLAGRCRGRHKPGYVGRMVAWVRDALRLGVTCATGALYDKYRECLRRPDISDYDVWTHRYDVIGPAELAILKRQRQALAGRGPLISVLLPVHGVPELSLRRCLESVLGQIYGRWELRIVDDGLSTPDAAKMLAEYTRRDERIQVTKLDRHECPGKLLNTALAAACGEFIVLLGATDKLRPHSLLRVAETVAAHSEVVVVYSDEDKVDADGQRYDPEFKPDWNPDLLYGRNYFGHLTSIRARLAREVGGFRIGFDGSEDYDLILRCIEAIPAEQIHHIPEILYHARTPSAGAMTPDSGAAAPVDAGRRALEDHFERSGIQAEVHTGGMPRSFYRVRWPLPKPAPGVSLIVPTRDRVDLLRTCVESIFSRSTYTNFELVIVDNQSSDPEARDYLHGLGRREQVRVLHYDAPFNYAAINNWAARQCSAPLLGLVNNDIEVITPDWLEEMASLGMRPNTGAVGAMLYYPNDTIQHAGVILGSNGSAGHVYSAMPRGHHGHGGRALVTQNFSAVTAACLLVRRKVFDAVGGLDERYAVAFNDVDFCLRVRACGYRNVWTPFAEMYHHESATRGDDVTPEKKALFMQEVRLLQEQWGDVQREDPAYNPNLTLYGHSFDLARPPRLTGGCCPSATVEAVSILSRQSPSAESHS